MKQIYSIDESKGICRLYNLLHLELSWFTYAFFPNSMLRLHVEGALARSWNSVEEAILITLPEWAVGALSSMGILSLDRFEDALQREEQFGFGHPCFLPAFSRTPWLADKSDPCWPSHSLLASEVVVFLKDMLQCWFIRWCRP